jgi:hypothetical protein
MFKKYNIIPKALLIIGLITTVINIISLVTIVNDTQLNSEYENHTYQAMVLALSIGSYNCNLFPIIRHTNWRWFEIALLPIFPMILVIWIIQGFYIPESYKDGLEFKISCINLGYNCLSVLYNILLLEFNGTTIISLILSSINLITTIIFLKSDYNKQKEKYDINKKYFAQDIIITQQFSFLQSDQVPNTFQNLKSSFEARAPLLQSSYL